MMDRYETGDERHTMDLDPQGDWVDYDVAQARIAELEARNGKLGEAVAYATQKFTHQEAQIAELTEALKLADGVLSGANMNRAVVERKVRAALGDKT
jgi:hypothetical protein